jgi:hypothetical protein
MHFSTPLAVISLVSFVRSAPVGPPATSSSSNGSVKTCPVSTFKLALPGNQTVLSIPAGVKPVYIALGVGVQNYTCSNGTFAYVSFCSSHLYSNSTHEFPQYYRSTGAVAALYDISCAHCLPGKPSSFFTSIPSIIEPIMPTSPPLSSASAIDAFLQTKLPSTLSGVFGKGLSTDLLGQHYFINNPLPNGTGLSPKFDFTSASQKGNPNAFVTLKKTGVSDDCFSLPNTSMKG